MDTRAVARKISPRAGFVPATSSVAEACVAQLAIPARSRILSQNDINSIVGTAICGGCQNLQMRVKQLEDEIKLIKTALQGGLDADIKQASTARTTRSKTKKGRKEDTLENSVAVMATEKQVAKPQAKKCPRPNISSVENRVSDDTRNCNGTKTSRDALKETEASKIIPPIAGSSKNTLSTGSGIDSVTGTTGCNSNSTGPWISLKSKTTKVASTHKHTVPISTSPVRSESTPNLVPIDSDGGTTTVTEREKSFIIQGLVEQTAATPLGQYSADRKFLKELIDEILVPNTSIEVQKTFRLGKRPESLTESTRPRPLKVIMSSSEEVKLILSRRFKLKDSNPGVFFQQDFSPAERLKRRLLVTELKRRRSEGEPNLVIYNNQLIQRPLFSPWTGPFRITAQSTH